MRLTKRHIGIVLTKLWMKFNYMLIPTNIPLSDMEIPFLERLEKWRNEYD